MPEPDAYTRRARVMPVLLVVSPALVFVATSALVEVKVAFGGSLLVGILTLLAAQLGRDRGRRLEPALWESWGGAPALRLLRFRGGEPAETVRRRHDNVAAATGRALPSAEQEAAAPETSDAAYEDALVALRELTRSTDDYRLLAAENADYGLRRNTLGLRGHGLAGAAVVLGGSALLFFLSDDAIETRLAGAGPAAAWSLGMLAFFGLVVRPEWVRVAAEAYAHRLIGAAEVLRRQTAAPHA